MNTKRNALGKGLGALLENESFISSPEKESGQAFGGANSFITHIPVNSIETNPFQPRTDFNSQTLNELADSIRQHGIIQPITVRGLGYDHYQIISGERRWRAAKMCGLEVIPAFVRIADDEGMLEMALVENIQRENLNPIEIALSFQRLIDELDIHIEALAEKTGKDRSTISNYLRLLKLPPIIQSALRENKISMGHARAIINVDDVAMQLKIFNDIMTGGLSVRSVETLVRGTKKTRANRKPDPGSVPPAIRNIQERLSGLYETKVEVIQRSGGSGKIQINYYSTEDLNRLLDMLDA